MQARLPEEACRAGFCGPTMVIVFPCKGLERNAQPTDSGSSRVPERWSRAGRLIEWSSQQQSSGTRVGSSIVPAGSLLMRTNCQLTLQRGRSGQQRCLGSWRRRRKAPHQLTAYDY